MDNYDDKLADVNHDASAEETLLTFPTRFPVKIIGKNTPDFQKSVFKIVNQHIADKDVINIHERTSDNQKYLSVTVTAVFYDKASIDAVYMALTRETDVIMAL